MAMTWQEDYPPQMTELSAAFPAQAAIVFSPEFEAGRGV